MDSGVLSSPINDAGYRVGNAVAADNLRIGRTVIADSVNPIPLSRDAWIEVANRAQVSAVEIEVTCSDTKEHQHRVETRISDIHRSRSLTWQDIVSRDYRPWNREHIVIDTASRNRHDTSRSDSQTVVKIRCLASACPSPVTPLAEITMADPHFKTLLTDRLGQFWKARHGQLFASAEGESSSAISIDEFIAFVCEMRLNLPWNPFDTGGVCPACLHQRTSTQCLSCSRWVAAGLVCGVIWSSRCWLGRVTSLRESELDSAFLCSF